MRASLIREHGGPEVIEMVADYPEPEIGAQDVLLKVEACALNFHDIFTRRGMPGITIPLPIITGSDIAGTVLARGEEVTGWEPGDRVLVDPVDHENPRPNLVGETTPGGRAERVSVPARQLIRLPDAIDLEEAAALPLAYATAQRMLFTIGDIQPGETMLVLGASGGVGTACVLLGKMAGVRVVACASSDAKVKRLLEIGADDVINYREAPFEEVVRTRYGKPRVTGASGGVDIVVNFTGGDTHLPSFKCLRRGGRMLICGATAGYAPTTDLRYLWSFEHQVLGSNGWSRADLEALLAALAAGRFHPAIDHRFSLEHAAEAEQLLESRQAFGKIILRP